MKKLFFLLIIILSAGKAEAVVADSLTVAKQMAEYKEALKEADRKIAERNQAWLDAQKKKVKYDTVGLAQYRYDVKLLNQERKAQVINFVKAHPDYLVSVAALTDAVGYLPDDIQKYDILFKSLSRDVQVTPEGQKLRASIDRFMKVAIGATAPEFTLNDTTGNPVSLSDFRGKYLLLDFWASWCGPCREENPVVVKAYNRFKDKNFEILSISLDQPGKRDAWIQAIREDKLNWEHVSDLKYWNCEAARLYSVRSIPQNFLLDPEGKIIASNLRGAELEKKLEELLTKKR
jgi:peroxiredoxin